MRRLLPAALLAIALAPAAALAAEIPIDRISLPVRSSRIVHLEFPVGELRVEPATGNQVTLELTGKCKRWSGEKCEDYADRIRIETSDTGGKLHLDVKGYPKGNSGGFSLIGVLRVPAHLDLKVDMGVGELTIEDIEGDLNVDLGVGEADIRTPRRSVRSVDVATGVGDASVIAAGTKVRKHGFISSAASWDEGRGRSNVTLHVGVGDATVRVN